MKIMDSYMLLISTEAAKVLNYYSTKFFVVIKYL